jgi:hypothetical protein
VLIFIGKSEYGKKAPKKKPSKAFIENGFKVAVGSTQPTASVFLRE